MDLGNSCDVLDIGRESKVYEVSYTLSSVVNRGTY